jgi:hypothetical protein
VLSAELKELDLVLEAVAAEAGFPEGFAEGEFGGGVLCLVGARDAGDGLVFTKFQSSRVPELRGCRVTELRGCRVPELAIFDQLSYSISGLVLAIVRSFRLEPFG